MTENPNAESGMNPEDFERFMKEFLAGRGMDADKLAESAGLPTDPAQLAQMINQIKAAMGNLGDGATGVNWQLAEKQAREIARAESKQITDEQRKLIGDAILIGALWLNEVTQISDLSNDPKLLTRDLWVADALPLFQSLSQPVAERMSDALTENMKANAPEELATILGDAGGLMRSAGGALFAMQLGQALGKLSAEVLTGGDIGLPIFKDQRAAFVPQNLDAFVSGLDLEVDQAYIYLAIREMAHARLFKHSKWLRDAIVLQISEYAGGIKIDNSRITEMAEDFDPGNTDAIREALESGAFIAERTPEQLLALARIETTLALIEGWVDVVTEEATVRLPKAAAIAEAVRRRRATGGPAEVTFGTLIGLELRPRRLREAAAMWREIARATSADLRDSLWNHPDLLPTAEDINEPSKLIAKLNGGAGDDLDQALRDLLGE